MTNFIQDAFNQAQETLTNFINNEENMKQVDLSIKCLVKTFNSNKRVFSCGNGGSMCDAMHFAEELTGRFRKDRPALGAISISDPSHMSCVSNDYGYEFIFSKFLEGWANEGDTLVAISSSGNSENVIQAVAAARKKGMNVIGLLGKDGGKLKDLVDFPIVVEGKLTDRVQEIHIKIIHTLIEGVERSLFPENY